MGLVKYENVGIRALSATVPGKIVKTRSLTEYYSEEAINKFIEATGIEERRLADDDVCASDLCYNSAMQIFEETDIKPGDIDALFVITQTPDYKSPGTAIIMQDRLGLPKTTLIYDLNLSCSGFVHGMMMAYSFLQSPSFNNIMVMVGDTLSHITSIKDKGTGMLLGDAGIAAVFSKNDKYGESYFSMMTEGGHKDSVMIPAGGGRIPSSPKTFEQKEYEDGSVRSLEQIVMTGTDVFSFAISALPKDVKRLLEFAGKSIDEIDKYAFHQANDFMTGYIAKKVKANPDKILHSIQYFGNTAGTSIPLCLVKNRDLIKPNESILMNAIGAGFVYGTSLINISDCQILELREL